LTAGHLLPNLWPETGALRFTFGCFPADTLQVNPEDLAAGRSPLWAIKPVVELGLPALILLLGRGQVAFPSLPLARVSEETPCVPRGTVVVQALGACWQPSSPGGN